MKHLDNPSNVPIPILVALTIWVVGMAVWLLFF